MSNNENTNNSNYKYLKVIAIVLYIVAAGLIIAGVASIASYAVSIVTGNNNGFFGNDFFEKVVYDESELDHIDFSGMVNGIGLIVFGFVLIAVASILMAIYRKKKIIETPTESTHDNLFDSVKQTISQQLKSVSEKLSPSTKSEETKEKSKHKVYCAYCGSELDENDKKCPSCGASKKFRK